MTIRIELWVDGRLVDGAEEWWDYIEASVPDGEEVGFPLLRRVDPYGDVLFERDELGALAAEVRRLLPRALEQARLSLEKLADLCDKGSLGSASELRFIGD
ncbi:hypothetical protein ACQPYH_35475 [Kribbella sp. CA-245084]|uniref:hypothetical protein n=1 Tax=Kribbella sp. CA-245084 TaxID=3239940 RepID=UPI003D900ACC